MTERLDRIEASLERSEQRAVKRDEDIDTLLGAIATTDRQVRDLRGESADAQQRFEVLRAEAQNDRQETRQLFNDAVAQIEIDRRKSDERFAEALSRIDAGQENIQRLLVELLNTNRDVSRLRDRVDEMGQAS